MEVIIIGKKYNLIGQRFGKLTVEKQTESTRRKKKGKYWLCRCDCGAEYITDSYELTSGHAKQCHDCAHAEIGTKRRKNYVGIRFGKLVVVDMIYKPTKNKKHSTYCKCICDCGNIVERNISGLKRGNGETIHSCGCAREEIADRKSRDIVGEVFGRLLVMDEIKTSSGRKVKCICECGNEMIASKCDVTSGHTQSCGCLQSERASESNQKDWIGYVSDYGVKLLAQSHQDSMGKWIWTCECFCGNTFCSLPIKIVSGHTTSCGCRRQSSREFFIEEVLKENNIDFQAQYTFPDCKNKYVLRFDFALLRDNKVFYLIEYDGMQHYTPIKHFGGIDGFEKTKSRDKIKNDYCENKSIPLLRLKYDSSDQEIKEKIVNILKP